LEFIPKNPNFEETIRRKLAKQHFMHHLGFRIDEIMAGKVTGYLEIEDIHLQQNDFIHGGVTSTVADLVMGFAAYSLVSEDQGTVTADLKIAYLRPGFKGKLRAVGYVIKQGHLLYFCEADIFCLSNGTEELIARGYSTMVAIDIRG
jgi:uncharacterized protein (TIGR00369 family)